jgi:hypothetical protein
MKNTVSIAALKKLPHKYQVMFAIFCAEQVIGLVKEQYREVCVKAIDTAKRWLRGEVSEEECRVAGAGATNAAGDAAEAAAASYVGYTSAASASYVATYATAGAAAHAAGAGASYVAAIYAANAATYAADAAHYGGLIKNNLVKEQWDYYYDLLNLDENLEKILVG